MGIIWFSPFKAQVGINITTLNSATILDIVSNSKGILFPVLSETKRNTSLADNDPSTIPSIGVANSSLSVNTLIFNTTENHFEFWDGIAWKQLFLN